MAGAADGVQYLRDMCITLCYFLQAYPSGSQLLLQGQAGIITHLTTLHDDLIPQIAKCGTAASQHQKSKAEQVRSLFHMLLFSKHHAQAHLKCLHIAHSVSVICLFAGSQPVNLSGHRLCNVLLAVLCCADIDVDIQAANNISISIVLTVPAAMPHNTHIHTQALSHKPAPS